MKVTTTFGCESGSDLLPLMDRIIAAFDRYIDRLFWNSMIKRGIIQHLVCKYCIFSISVVIYEFTFDHFET